MILDTFKKRISDGEVVFGPFMKTGDAAFVEIAGHAGFDFVILDMEHGPASWENLQNLIRGAILAGTVPIVRTSDSSEISISSEHMEFRYLRFKLLRKRNHVLKRLNSFRKVKEEYAALSERQDIHQSRVISTLQMLIKPWLYCS